VLFLQELALPEAHGGRKKDEMAGDSPDWGKREPRTRGRSGAKRKEKTIAEFTFGRSRWHSIGERRIKEMENQKLGRDHGTGDCAETVRTLAATGNGRKEKNRGKRNKRFWTTH